MKLLRSLRFRSYLMPLVLAALVLRVLIPMEGMAADGMGFASPMCSTIPGRSETLEIPADSPQPHCDRCLLSPPFIAPVALLNFEFARAVPLPLSPEHLSQVPESPLARAQSARAPPRA